MPILEHILKLRVIEYVLQMKCNNKEDALYLEKYIKRMKSRKFVQKIIDTPKILEDILLKR